MSTTSELDQWFENTIKKIYNNESISEDNEFDAELIFGGLPEKSDDESKPMTYSDYLNKLDQSSKIAINSMYGLKSATKKVHDNESISEDNKINPSHYKAREDCMETIDEMILVFGLHDTMIFCEMNAWKYRARALYKNGEEDMKKSDWYLKKCKELKQRIYAGNPTV